MVCGAKNCDPTANGGRLDNPPHTALQPVNLCMRPFASRFAQCAAKSSSHSAGRRCSTAPHTGAMAVAVTERVVGRSVRYPHPVVCLCVCVLLRFSLYMCHSAGSTAGGVDDMLLLCHATGFCKELWEPGTIRCRRCCVVVVASSLAFTLCVVRVSHGVQCWMSWMRCAPATASLLCAHQWIFLDTATAGLGATAPTP